MGKKKKKNKRVRDPRKHLSIHIDIDLKFLMSGRGLRNPIQAWAQAEMISSSYTLADYFSSSHFSQCVNAATGLTDGLSQDLLLQFSAFFKYSTSFFPSIS